MEVEQEEQDEDLGELCAEILENWNSPVYSSLHQNPFSLHHTYDIKTIQEKVDICSIVPHGQALSCTDAETKNSTSKPKYEDSTEDFEKQKERKILMKTLKTTYNEKGSKHEQVTDQPLIPVLVADTFFDRLLGRGVDGIDIAALNKVKEAKACDEAGDTLRIILNENDATESTATTNNRKEIEKLNSCHISSRFKCNGSPIAGENRRMPATRIAAPTEIRSCSGRGSVSKLRFMLPSNKTIFDIDIDNFGEKLWRNPGVDISDFFNYGLDEKQWKDYCKLMQAQVQVETSGRSKIKAPESRQSHKQGAIGEAKLDRGIDECLPFKDSKDPSFNDSDVIIEIVMRDSFCENELNGENVKNDGVSTDAEGSKPLSDNENTQHVNCRMINGDKILPFPLDSYASEDSYRNKEKIQNNDDAHLAKRKNYRMSTNINEGWLTNTHGETLGQNTLAYRKIKQNYLTSYSKKMVN